MNMDWTPARRGGVKSAIGPRTTTAPQEYTIQSGYTNVLSEEVVVVVEEG